MRWQFSEAGKFALVLLIMLLLVVIASTTHAAPPASPYEPGETLAPTCTPGSTNCTVRAFAVSGANTDITSILGLTTPLSVLQGGTGLSAYAVGDLIYATGPSALGVLPGGGGVLSFLQGTPTWQATSTLGLLTDSIAEGTQKYFTESRVSDFLGTISKGYFFSTSSSNTWLGTKSTTDLVEGSRLFFTDARADNRINATSTISTLTSAPNLASLGTIVSGVWRGTAIDAASYLTNFGVPFYQFFSGTTTDALTEGVGHRFFTDARADGRINATSTIGTLTGAPNLASIGTIVSGVWRGTAIDAASYLTNFGTPFYQFLSSTTTDALPEGGTHKFFTADRARSALSALTGISYNSLTGEIGNNGVLSLSGVANKIAVSASTGSISLSLPSLLLLEQASTSALSVSGPAFFGTTATSSFSSAGLLTLAGIGTNMLLSSNGLGGVVASSSPTAAAYTATSTNSTSSFAGSLSAGNVLSVIQSTGRVGIGTTSPWRTFSLDGSLALDGLGTVSGISGRALCLSGSGSGDVLLNLAVSCLLSSERFKHGIETASNGLEIIRRVRPVTFFFNEDTEDADEQFGFIAEEMVEVEPRLIDFDEEGLPLTVRYEEFTAVLALALQELDTRVSSLPSFDDFFVPRVRTEELCVGTTCITEQELKALLEVEQEEPEPVVIPPPEVVPEPPPEEPLPVETP